MRRPRLLAGVAVAEPETPAPDEGRVCGLRAAGFCIAVAKRERDLEVMPLARMRERR
jgi:hypothetical protein